MQPKNLFAHVTPPPVGEEFATLLAHKNLVIERILSSAHTTPCEYVQTQDEWVVLLHGDAVLEVAGKSMVLKPGDHLFLPSGTPHTVQRVSEGALWLAVHLHGNEPSQFSTTTPVLSVTIPAHNEERFIGRCIESVFRSAQQARQAVEVVVALNRCTDQTRSIAESLGARCVVEDKKCISAVRNAAIRASTAPAIATIDADSWMSDQTVAAVIKRVYDPRYVGGGSMIHPERMSIGLFFSVMTVLPYVIKHRLSYGMFWFMRATFEELNGFDEAMVSVEDVDFALRLRALGRQRGQKYGTVWRHGITTSCRKFDTFGDWYFFKNPDLVRRIFEGDRAAANHFFYDVDR